MFYVGPIICRHSDIEKELDNKFPVFMKECSKGDMVTWSFLWLVGFLARMEPGGLPSFIV